MAKIGLAAELAKQAAQAAREELAATEPVATKPAAFGGWHVPKLPVGFALDAALDAALNHAQSTLNRQLRPEGLVVQRPQGGAQNNGNGAGGLSGQAVQVTEAQGGKVVREYKALDLLKLYASQRGAGGAVVDGQV